VEYSSTGKVGDEKTRNERVQKPPLKKRKSGRSGELTTRKGESLGVVYSLEQTRTFRKTREEE